MALHLRTEAVLPNQLWYAHLKSGEGVLDDYAEYLEGLKLALNNQRSKNWEDELRRQGELACIDKLLNFITIDEREDKAYLEYQHLKEGN